jgi:hypothetical protein
MDAALAIAALVVPAPARAQGDQAAELAKQLSNPLAALIVAETMGHRLTAFDIQADGSLANRRAYAQSAALWVVEVEVPGAGTP